MSGYTKKEEKEYKEFCEEEKSKLTLLYPKKKKPKKLKRKRGLKKGEWKGWSIILIPPRGIGNNLIFYA